MSISGEHLRIPFSKAYARDFGEQYDARLHVPLGCRSDVAHTNRTFRHCDDRPDKEILLHPSALAFHDHHLLSGGQSLEVCPPVVQRQRRIRWLPARRPNSPQPILIAQDTFKESFILTRAHMSDLIDGQHLEAVEVEVGHRMYQHELTPHGKRETEYRRTLAAVAFDFDAFSTVDRPSKRSSWFHA